jgi:hypothetical protein
LGHFWGHFDLGPDCRSRKSLFTNNSTRLLHFSHRRKSLFLVDHGTLNVPKCPTVDTERRATMVSVLFSERGHRSTYIRVTPARDLLLIVRKYTIRPAFSQVGKWTASAKFSK